MFKHQSIQPTTHRSPKALLAALCLGGVLAGSQAFAASTVILAETGDAAPGGDTLDLAYGQGVAMGDNGAAVFSSLLAVSRDYAVLTSSGGALTQLARSGDSFRSGAFELDRIAPGDPDIAINASGQVVMQASTDRFDNVNSNLSSIVLADGGSPSLIAISGDPTPSGSDAFSQLTSYLTDLSDSGMAAFSARTTHPTDEYALFRYQGGATPMTEIVRGGDPVPGGGTFSNRFQFGEPTINNAGQIAFKSVIDDTFSGDSGVFRSDGSSTTVIARKNFVAPGGGTFYGFGSGSSVPINNSGLVAFMGSVDVTSGNDYTMIGYGDGNTITQIARTGEPAAGGGALRGFSRHIAFNDSDQILAEASITFDGFTEDGLFLFEDGAMTRIAITGATLPNGNGTFSIIGNDGFALNDNGGVAFHARFSNATYSNDDVVLYYDDSLGLVEVARVGEVFGGSVIESLAFQGVTAFDLTTQAHSGLNDAGQVAYSYRLEDGTLGVALWSAYPTPIPGDTDGDGDIDDSDLGTAFSNYTGPLAPGTGGKTAVQGDADGDGDVDDSDLGTAFSGYTGPLAVNVPEPTSLTLLLLAGLGLSGRRR